MASYAPSPPGERSVFITSNNRFPADLDQLYYHVAFLPGVYRRESLTQGAIVTQTGSPIALPMPDKINEVQTVVWKDKSLTDEIGAAGRSLSGSVSSLLPGKLSHFLGSAGGILGLAKSAGEWQSGYRLNPYLIMMFENNTFKKHTMTWTGLTPRNTQETSNLDNIIKTLRKSMLPEGAWKPFLEYPRIFEIQLHPDSHLFKFKRCALTEMQTDFTGAGQPSFFAGTQAPTSYTLTLHFTELDLWFYEDL